MSPPDATPPDAPDGRRLGPWIAGALGLALVALTFASRWSTLDAFFGAFDKCKRVFCDFQTVYYQQALEMWHAAVPVFGYYYSGFFAVLLAPLAKVPPGRVLLVWGLIEGLATVLLCALPIARVLRLSGYRAVAYVLLFATSLPVLHNFKWGQVSVFVTLTVVASLWAYRAGRPALAGTLLALGISIKYYPVIFVPWYLFARERRFLVALALGTLAFFVVVPGLFLGFEHWWAFQDVAFSTVWKAVWMVDDQNSQFLPHVVQRLGARHGLALGAGAVDVLTWISAAIAFANVALVYGMRRRRVADGHELSALLLFLSIPLLIKTSWPHYFVHLPFCQALLFAAAARTPAWRRRQLPVQGLVVLSVALSSVFFFNLFDHWTQYSSRGFLLLANVLLLVGAWAVVARRLASSVDEEATAPAASA